jgi:alpha-glucosidase
MQYVGEVEIKTLELHAYYTSAYRESCLYEDAGDGYEDSNEVTFIMSGESEDDTLVIRQQRVGNYKPTYSEYLLTIHGLTYKPTLILIDGKEASFSKKDNKYILTVPFDFSEIQVPAGKKTTKKAS